LQRSDTNYQTVLRIHYWSLLWLVSTIVSGGGSLWWGFRQSTVGGWVQDRPIADAEPLPGRFVLPGLADAHAHPGVAGGPAGFVPRDAGAVRATLVAWAQAGITVVRDVGPRAG
jgi:imidazolonepropionase-like amidohydrolase